MNTYTVILIADTEVGGYTAYVPAIPGCVTEGDTVEEAIAMAQDAAAALIAIAAERGDDIPDEAHQLTITAAIAVAVPDRIASPA